MDAATHPLLATIPKHLRPRFQLGRADFEDGAVVYSPGDALDSVFFVLEGSLQLIHEDSDLGIRSVMDSVGSGEVFGEAFEGQVGVSRFQVVAHGPVEAVAFSADDFQELCKESAEFSSGFLRYMASKRALLEDRASASSKIELNRVCLDLALVARVTTQYIVAKRVLPLALQAGSLVMASVAADTSRVEQDMRRLLGVSRVIFYRVADRDFDKICRRALQVQVRGVSGDTEATWFRGVKGKEYHVVFETVGDSPVEATKKDAELDGAAVVSLTNKIIGEAMDLGASDVHFEPFPGGMEVRYRLDGELVRRPDRVPQSYLHAVLSRVKVLSGLDISEKRRPQDGRLSATSQGKRVDVRVSTVPTRFGEKIVLRILDPGSMLIELDSLLEIREVRDSVKWMIQQPYGMVLIAGPTGSGKTTTVYSMLLAKRDEPVNIVTIEDPIEYSLAGVVQVQRNPHVGLDFPHAIRSFLRQDPDVIIVGETRDPETAKAALEAGLTGHLVISTIHANNVFATVYRLKEMGMESFVIANSVIGILSQRLVRRVCAHCSQTVQYHRHLIDPLGLAGIGSPVGNHYSFRKGPGCSICNFKGYKGRVAAFESLRITDELKPLLAANVPLAEMRKRAGKLNLYHPMENYAALLLNQGVTTPEEVSRILFTQGD